VTQFNCFVIWTFVMTELAYVLGTTQPEEDTVDRLLYPVDEAAEILGIGRTKAWEMAASGELPTVRVGHRRLVRADDLEHYAAALPHVAAEPDDVPA
jgi:excisionase family DNA binding protein